MKKHVPWCKCLVCTGQAVWMEEWLELQRERDELLVVVKELPLHSKSVKHGECISVNCCLVHNARMLLDKIKGKK